MFLGFHEVGSFENREVARQSGFGEREELRQFTSAAFATAKRAEDFPAGRIGKGFEYLVHGDPSRRDIIRKFANYRKTSTAPA